MPTSPTIARTRVVPPPIVDHQVERPSLLARLDVLQSGGLAAVLAGAGCGKTSLLAAWATHRSEPTAWYSVSEGDDDVEVFVAHVVAAVDVVLGTSLPAPDGVRWRAALDAAINAILERPGFALVLDDVHRLESEDTREALTYLLRYLPAGAAVVLAARRLPALREWNAWTARGRVRLTLHPPDLALSEEEVARLLELRRGSADRAAELRQRVGGWPLAVDLLARAPELSLPETGDQDLLDDYITHEVWTDLPEADRAFLEDCSVLETWTTELCAAVARREDSARILGRLAGLGLVARGDGGTWRMHQVFLDFLARRRAAEPAAERERQRRAAEALGRRSEAIPHLIAAGDREGAAEAMAETPLPRARILSLSALLGDDFLDQRPELRVLRGHALRRGNAFEEALAELERAAERARVARQPAVEARALAEGASVYVDTVQPARADAMLRKAYRLTPGGDTEERARILDLIAENCVNQGRAAAALRYRRWSRSLLARPRNGVLDARILLRTGQLSAARATVEARLEAAPRQAPEARAHREEVLVLAYIAALEGDTATAEQAARRGLDLGATTASPFTEAVAWMRLGHALQLKPDANFEEVVACYARAQALAEQTGVQRIRAEALMGLALAYAAAGDVPRSYAHATDGLAITRTAGDTWLSAWLRLATGIAGLAGRHPDATAVLGTARGEMAACRDAFGTSVADLWLALAGSPEQLAAAAPALRSRGHAFLLERPTLFGPRKPVAVVPSADELRLRIRTLGPFRIWRGHEEVSARAWKREKARELFLVLLTRRGSALQKEALMDLLWPDATPQAANRDFRVALHALSDALDPERPRNALARCIERRGTAYALKSGAEIEIDADEMERLVGLGNREGNPDLWSKAMDLYRGDYLEDFPYAEWAGGERDRLRAMFVDTAEKLARCAYERSDDEAALGLAHAILARDRCWEEAWRIVMRVHQRQGRGFLAARAFEDCSAALEEELGVEPSEETRALLP